MNYIERFNPREKEWKRYIYMANGNKYIGDWKNNVINGHSKQYNIL